MAISKTTGQFIRNADVLFHKTCFTPNGFDGAITCRFIERRRKIILNYTLFPRTIHSVPVRQKITIDRFERCSFDSF